ncbi:esterase-like activity of phytase family protein [Breoghania sp. L-A4]|uniref:esterase-like activity of phytase family protein n=1 Tax=Breoghania sp. L-A4 TaxID=2304600 RepID=UPI0013C319A8|nr:esterase-like activity of phytase family protein [Breoghania sp. L-A4]
MPLLASSNAAAAGATPVAISAEPLGGFRGRYPAEKVFGQLEWLGGLRISSSDPRFGGFSGLLSLRQGERLLAVSDRGNWFSARISQDADGTPLDVTEATMGPVLDKKGVSLDNRHRGDAEALTMTPDGGTIFVAFEQQHRVLAWDGAQSIPGGLARRVKAPAAIKTLDGNKGLEGLAASAADGPLKGALVGIAERDPQERPGNPGWIFGPGRETSFRLRQSDDFDVTDAAFLPGGDLLVLERRFNLRYGLGMRLRRIRGADLGRGGAIDASLVMEADLRHQIDNMEGLAVHQNAAGQTIITMISDDNQSVLQRTVLLRFRLIDAPQPGSMDGPDAVAPDAASTGAQPRAKP